MRRRLSRAGNHGVAKAIAFPALLFLVLVVCAGDRTPQIKQDRDSESFRISVDVALVVLPATVIDRQGALSPIWASRTLRFMRTVYHSASGFSKTKIFRSLWAWLSTIAQPWDRNWRR